LDSYISTNVILKKSLSKHFGGIEVLSALDETSFLQSDTIALKKIKVAIKDKKTLYDQYEALSELKEDKNFSFVDLLPSNTQLLELFCGKFLSALQSYYLEKNPEDKTLKAKYLNNVIKEVYNFINTTPTELGVEGICVCLEAIEKSLKGVETITRKSAKPEIAIELVEKNVCPDSEGFFHIRVRAKNAPSTITASKVCFELQSEDVEACKVKQVYIDNLKGGAIHDFEYIVKLKQEFLNENSWKFAVNCSYVFDDENSSTNFSPLHVYLSPSTFVAIEHNPYTYGPALKSSDPTFVGRQNDIEEIIDAVLHPEREGAQLIVYGQKRCGKSSLVQAVQSKLERDYSDKALCVYSTLRVEGKDKEKYTEADFYYSILKSIKIVLDGLENKPDLNVPSRLEFKQSSSSTEIFSNCIRDFKQSMRNCSGWKEKRLVLIIDEFTILYNYIKKGVADEGVLHYWKGIQESKDTNFATIFVGHDITPTFFAEPYASNATAIIEKHPLSYLSVDEAKDLIINPISCDGESRFEEKAIEAILYYTACSPSYLQQFMKRMVEYINKEKIVKVTDSDVHYVAQQFIQKNYDEYAADAISSFDNLINSGLDDRYSSIKDKDVENVLRLIALKSKGVEWCNVEDVVKHNYKDENAIESLNKILDDLDSRKVIERRDNNKRIKIKVGIFKEWLIKN